MDNKGIDANGNEYKFTDEGLIYDGKYLTKYQILASALILDEYKYAKAMLDVARYFRGDDIYFNELFFAVEWTFIDKFDRKNVPNELTIQAAFKNKYKDIIVDIKNDGKNIPDAWIKEDDLLKPVEVKRNKFDAKALRQLERYLKVYGCSNGVAVAKVCTVKLPDYIRFIPISDFYKKEET